MRNALRVCLESTMAEFVKEHELHGTSRDALAVEGGRRGADPGEPNPESQWPRGGAREGGALLGVHSCLCSGHVCCTRPPATPRVHLFPRSILLGKNGRNLKAL